MEQAKITSGGRHSGWSAEETSLLWETADEALKNGLPLKQVFERIAEKTGRRPNSIRNYYYAQARAREGEGTHLMRFVPFTEDEVRSLVETVLRHKAQGQSVRSCLQALSGGDHSLMLRYQNKYRAILRTRPALIAELVEKLRAEGVECPQPQVRERAAAHSDGVLDQLMAGAKESGDPELLRACGVFARLIRSGQSGNDQARLDRMAVRLDLYRLALTDQTRALRSFCETADELSGVIKDFLIADRNERAERLDAFCDQLSERLGQLEGCVTQARAVPDGSAASTPLRALQPDSSALGGASSLDV